MDESYIPLKYSVSYDFFSIWELVFFTQDIARDYCLKRSSKYFGKNSKRSVESST